MSLTSPNVALSHLEMVCAKEGVVMSNRDTAGWMLKPFTIDTRSGAVWTCATNGALFVAVQGKIEGAQPLQEDASVMRNVRLVLEENGGDRIEDLTALRAFAGPSESLYIPCSACEGKGEVTCDECKGAKYVKCDVCEGARELDAGGDAWDDLPEPCYACAPKTDEHAAAGKGEIGKPCGVVPCEVCSGSGSLTCEDCDGVKLEKRECDLVWIFGYLFDRHPLALGLSFCPELGDARIRWSALSRGLSIDAVGARVALMPMLPLMLGNIGMDNLPSFGDELPEGLPEASRALARKSKKLHEKFSDLVKVKP